MPDATGSVGVASIVVVNKGDERVADTLAALSGLDEPLLREVVVVDASGGRLDSVRERFPDVRWIDYVHPSGKHRTIAEQRNEGVRAASGDVIVFLDANCVPSAGWLPSLLAPILDAKEQIVVGAITSTTSRTVHDREPRRGAGPGPVYLSECANMNVAFSREVFDTVGTFDEQLGFAEDVDFAWRANDAGCRIYYEPEAVITHDWGDFRENLPRAFRYGVARTRLLRKHRSRVTSLFREDRYILMYALFVAFLPIAVVFPAYLLLLAYPLAKNRASRPFATVTYQLVYAAGLLSELLHIPVMKGQRKVRSAPA